MRTKTSTIIKETPKSNWTYTSRPGNLLKMSQDVSNNETLKRRYIPINHNKTNMINLKITLAFGFLSHLIRVRPMVYDDRQ